MITPPDYSGGLFFDLFMVKTIYLILLGLNWKNRQLHKFRVLFNSKKNRGINEKL